GLRLPRPIPPTRLRQDPLRSASMGWLHAGWERTFHPHDGPWDAVVRKRPAPVIFPCAKVRSVQRRSALMLRVQTQSRFRSPELPLGMAHGKAVYRFAEEATSRFRQIRWEWFIAFPIQPRRLVVTRHGATLE